MSLIFLATVGQRPAAVTMAFDLLGQRYKYSEIGFIVTDPQHPNIKSYHQQLLSFTREDFPDYDIVNHIVRDTENQPLIDIHNSHDAEIYFRNILSILKSYREDGHHIHFLVAGGRKAMTTYATIAASLIFGINDHVYTIISSEKLIREGHRKVPIGRSNEVEIVPLPMLPSRLLPNMLPMITVTEIIELTNDSRERFLGDLTEIEHNLVETVYQNPRATYKKLGNMLNKSPRTIENQLAKIYTKMLPYYEIQNTREKKNTLIDVMAGRI